MKINNLKYKNIYWFLLDGLSPLFLNSLGASENSPTFIDELLKKGTTFSRVYSAGAGTHTSMHAFFSGLYPATNGALGWTRAALRGFDPEINTIADYFHEAGYSTFRYCDAKLERTVPMSGFDCWSSSGIYLPILLNKTNFCDCPRRTSFIEKVNTTTTPKFVYHHSELFHELNGRLGCVWPSEIYKQNISIFAKYIKELLELYKITDDDLVIISSDHGVILDKNYVESDIKEGIRHEEISALCFWSVIGKDIEPNRVCNKLVSAVDIAPTLMQLALQKEFPGQGSSLCEYIKDDNAYTPRVCFREKGSFYLLPQSADKSKCWVARDEKWKYALCAQGKNQEWLMDLKDGDYKINLKDKYPDIAKKYRTLIEDTLINKVPSYKDVLASHGITKILPKKPVISIVAKITHINTDLFGQLMDFAGPHYEVILISELKNLSKYFEKVSYVKVVSSLAEAKNSIQCNYVFHLNPRYHYGEEFLSNVYNEFIRLKRYNSIRVFNARNVYFCPKNIFLKQRLERACYLKEEDIELYKKIEIL